MSVEEREHMASKGRGYNDVWDRARVKEACGCWKAKCLHYLPKLQKSQPCFAHEHRCFKLPGPGLLVTAARQHLYLQSSMKWRGRSSV